MALPPGVARVRLHDLRATEGHAREEWLSAVRRKPRPWRVCCEADRTARSQVEAVAASLSATGALVLALDEDAAVQGVEALCASAVAWFAAPPAEKQRYAARSDVRGACGYRSLPNKQLVEIRLGCAAALTPELLQRGAQLVLTVLGAAGRAVLAALGRRLKPHRDLAAFCEPAPLEPGALGVSVLRVLEYDALPDADHAAGAPSAEAHVDGGLLALIASHEAGLEIRGHGAGGSWAPLPLRRGEVAILAGATLQAATGDAVQACMHRVAAQGRRVSLALLLRGAPDAQLPARTVAEFEAEFVATHASINRHAGGAAAAAAAGSPAEARSGKRKLDEADGAREAPPAQRHSGKASSSAAPRAAAPAAPAPAEQINIKIKDQARLLHGPSNA
jgi:isopenicillin N synthase-like dioxygenase